MSVKRSSIRRFVCLTLAVGVVLWVAQIGPAGLRDLALMYLGTPHERYAASLRRSDAADTPAGRGWLESAERSLKDPTRLKGSGQLGMAIRAGDSKASAFIIPVKRGQRLIAAARPQNAEAGVPFIDVFENLGPGLRHVANTTPGAPTLDVEPRDDADYILRIQSSLLQTGMIAVDVHTEPTLRIPVDGATARNVQSFFGASRDGGRRAHQGVDIFAVRGTPVRAAASGIVTSVGPNALGGNTIWITRPARGEFHYYAHLDRQLVTAGTYVHEGDVIGLVGNTGNARTTAPHLHFGIYTARGAVDPLPYIAAPAARASVATPARVARRTLPSA